MDKSVQDKLDKLREEVDLDKLREEVAQDKLQEEVATKKAKMNSYDSKDANIERPNIAEKVRFWEEQDKINQVLIPRVKELHEIVTDLHKRTSNISSQIAEAEARVLQKVQEQNEQRFKQMQSQIPKYTTVTWVDIVGRF